MPKETFIPICNHLKYPNDGWIHMCIYCNVETAQYKEYKKIITNSNEKLYALMLCNKCQSKINTDSREKPLIIDKINDCLKHYPVEPNPPSPRSVPPKSSSLFTNVT